MNNYNKPIEFKPHIGVKMEAKLTGIASPEDAGEAMKTSYKYASYGLMVMLSCFGLAAVIFAISFLI